MSPCESVSQSGFSRLQANFLPSSDKCIYVNYSPTPETIGRTQIIPRGALILLCQFTCSFNSMQVAIFLFQINSKKSKAAAVASAQGWLEGCITIIPPQRETDQCGNKGVPFHTTYLGDSVERKVAQSFSLLLEGWKAAEKKSLWKREAGVPWLLRLVTALPLVGKLKDVPSTHNWLKPCG